ncbi:MAG: insulinase family protein [Chloroflexi bacterium]|nr:insulinase family protein [Chloroflexota bacterium]
MRNWRSSTVLFFIILIMLCAFPASAATDSATQRSILPNGMVLLTKEVHSAPVVSLVVGVNVGSRNERLGVTGMSHFLEHMLFKGTEKFPPGEISKILNQRGAEFNAYTSNDLTAFYETLPKDFLKSAMYIEADRFVNSVIDPEEFKHERVVILSELEGGENDPMDAVYKSLGGITFQSHPYHWPVIGYTKDVEQITNDQIKQYYKTYYVPNNAALVIVGDIDTDKVKELAGNVFGKIPKGNDPPPVIAKEEPQTTERRVIVRRNGCQPLVAVAVHVPDVKDPDMHALQVLDAMLTTGRTSRMYKRLVQGNLCVSAGSYMPTAHDPSAWEIFARLRPGVSHQKVEDEIWNEIKNIQAAPPAEEELKKAKTLLKSDFFRNCESASEIAQNIAYYEAVGDYTFLDRYVEKVDAVTAADITRVANKYFDRQYQNAAWLIPEEEKKSTAGSYSSGDYAWNISRFKPSSVPRAFYSERAPALKASRETPPVIGGFNLKYNRYLISNGMVLMVQENHGTPGVTVAGYLKGGSGYDPKGKDGLSNFTSSMLLSGAAGQTWEQLSARLDNIGATLNYSCDREKLNFGGWCLKDTLPSFLSVLHDTMTAADFPKDQIEKNRQQILSTIKKRDDSPGERAFDVFQKLVYPENYPLAHSVYGNSDSVKSINRNDLAAFYKNLFRPDNVVIVVVGDVDSMKLAEQFEEVFGSWKAEGPPPSLSAEELTIKPGTKLEIIKMPGKIQEEIIMGHVGISRLSEDYYAFNLMNFILGGSTLTGRLGTEIRDKNGLAYGVYSYLLPYRLQGSWFIGMGVNPRSVSKAITLANKVVKEFQEKGPTEEELAAAKAALINRLPASLENNASIADMILNIYYYDLPDDYLEKYPETYNSITADKIKEVAGKYLQPDSFVTVTAGPMEELKTKEDQPEKAAPDKDLQSKEEPKTIKE